MCSAEGCSVIITLLYNSEFSQREIPASVSPRVFWEEIVRPNQDCALQYVALPQVE